MESATTGAPRADDEVAFRLHLEPAGIRQTLHLTVGMTVGPDVYLQMVFQPTTLRSTISTRILNDLRGRGLIPDDGRDGVLLQELRIERQPVPDMLVRHGPAASFLDFDGILGADFLRPFTELRVNLKTLWVTLVR